jgi:branched-subunit amino acid ABC-type transport system permease component
VTRRDELPTIPPSLDHPAAIQFKHTLAFLVIIAVLLVRPKGLFGREFKGRV